MTETPYPSLDRLRNDGLRDLARAEVLSTAEASLRRVHGHAWQTAPLIDYKSALELAAEEWFNEHAEH